MTANEFTCECIKRTINPAIALENKAIRQALKDRDDKKTRSKL